MLNLTTPMLTHNSASHPWLLHTGLGPWQKVLSLVPGVGTPLIAVPPAGFTIASHGLHDITPCGCVPAGSRSCRMRGRRVAWQVRQQQPWRQARMVMLPLAVKGGYMWTLLANTLEEIPSAVATKLYMQLLACDVPWKRSSCGRCGARNAI